MRLFKKLNRFDWLIITLLVLATLFSTYKYLDSSIQPLEDAAILLRYSQHFSQGHGFVWNIGEKPVDGATDFLYMLVVGLLAKAGLPLVTATHFLGFFSHLLTVILVYIFIRIYHDSPMWAAFVSAAFLVLGPARFYIATGFGTTFFALGACVSWCYANLIVKDENPANSLLLAFALSGLVTGLIRPEGVFLAVFMLLSIIYMKGFKESQKAIIYFSGVFLLLGGLFFIWRWFYFGYPLPNPFYKKGGGLLHIYSLNKSLTNTFNLGLPVVLMLILGLRSFKTAKQTIFVMIPVACFTVIWVLLSNEMNYLSRFQYAILPIMLISWPALIQGMERDWLNSSPVAGSPLERRVTLISLIVLLSMSAFFYQYQTYKDERIKKDSKYEVAKILKDYSGKNYVIATTEAGLIPLYSEWKTLDAWGLNDQWIAHNGSITQSYLDRYQPQVIVFHAFAYMMPLQRKQAWDKMLLTLQAYVKKNSYVLAAAFGAHRKNIYFYYVRPNFPDSGEIITRIRNMNYYLGANKFTNFALN